MNFGVAFAPLVSLPVVWAALAIAIVLAVLLIVSRSRGRYMRTFALALFVLALANPSITREDRDPLTSVAAVIIDKSPSQEFGDRTAQTEAVRARIAEQLGKIPGIEARFVEAGQSDGETDGTRLFSALSTALSDVPHDRVAGAIMITDGRVHDVPTDTGALGFAAPVHALITGHANERDRRVVLITTPRFGIVGQSQTISFRVEDQGAPPGTAQVAIRRDGETLETRPVRVGQQVSINVPIPHAGPNIVEIDASPLENELTTVNNRAVVSIDGVRDKLRVLLVSGEPHAGERTWRNLLKSDASRRPRSLHHPAAAGKAGRHADQRTLADRVPDPRAVLATPGSRSTTSNSSSSTATRAKACCRSSISTTSPSMSAAAARYWWRPAPTTRARPASGARRLKACCRPSRADARPTRHSWPGSPSSASAIR